MAISQARGFLPGREKWDYRAYIESGKEIIDNIILQSIFSCFLRFPEKIIDAYNRAQTHTVKKGQIFHVKQYLPEPVQREKQLLFEIF